MNIITQIFFSSITKVPVVPNKLIKNNQKFYKFSNRLKNHQEIIKIFYMRNCLTGVKWNLWRDHKEIIKSHKEVISVSSGSNKKLSQTQFTFPSLEQTLSFQNDKIRKIGTHSRILISSGRHFVITININFQSLFFSCFPRKIIK